jgi:peptidoglycan hydrolase-like protein with peptidoglycan-binding domain
MILADLRNPPGDSPVSPSLQSAERARAGRRSVCPRAFVAAGVVLMLAGCELPSSLEDLTKVFEGESQKAQVAPAVEGQPQNDLEAAAAAVAQAESTEHSDAAGTKSTQETILTAQKLLAGLGYEPGPLDGLDGPKTRDAVRKYQADASLPTDGRITKALVEGLSELDRDTTGRSHGPGLAGKALPLYAAGDTFIYSDGRTETVTDIDGDRVQWQSNDGAVITAHRDFVLPAIRRETDLLSEQTTVDGGPGALWPLKAGREVSFTAKTEVTHKASPGPRNAFTSQWHCLVEPSRTVSVAAGTFDALRVACRTSTPSSQGPSERVWYYAPRIRHYVLREERFESPASESHVELVAIQSEGKNWPPAARAGLGWALQQALETKTEKQSIEWRSSGVDAEVTIRPTTAMSTGDSPYCRTFEQTVRRARGQRIYPGKACRSPSGRWLIPGLEIVPQAARSGS